MKTVLDIEEHGSQGMLCEAIVAISEFGVPFVISILNRFVVGIGGTDYTPDEILQDYDFMDCIFKKPAGVYKMKIYLDHRESTTAGCTEYDSEFRFEDIECLYKADK